MAAAQKNRYGAVYGLAKGLGMDRESLHEYIYRETGRASLTELTDPELRRLVVSMGRMKDGGQQAPRRKRTDTGGTPETAALLLVRPVSGSGALAVGSQIMEQYGPDSAVGRTAAVMLGCSETTFYTVAVYFGAAGIRRTRYTIPAALTADLAAFVAAAWAVRLCFG